MNIEILKQQFLKEFGTTNEEIKTFFSPGRVNLIGEHTDYNGGYVFPCALSFGTYLLVRKTNSNVIKMSTTNFTYKTTIPITDINKKHDKEWVNYPLGVMVQMANKGLRLSGLEMLYSGDIPNGAGLSSSASIEMVTAYALNTLFNLGLDRWSLVKLSQAAENQFVGVNCGIMDQFASGMGEKDHALMLNCETLEYEKVPLKLSGYKIIIGNTNKRRGLADSKYNERRGECEKAVEYIQKIKPIKKLGELNLAEFKQVESSIPEEIIRRRARHVVSEDQRVLDAVVALKKGDLKSFGTYMNQSHDSLRDNYEVTGIELDTMVEEARKIEGVIGSRMTGAGFGGCTVSIVAEQNVPQFIDQVGKNYEKRTGLKPDFYIAGIGDGSKQL